MYDDEEQNEDHDEGYDDDEEEEEDEDYDEGYDDEDCYAVDEHYEELANLGGWDEKACLMEKNCNKGCVMCDSLSDESSQHAFPLGPDCDWEWIGEAQKLAFLDSTREPDIQWIINKGRNYMSKVVPKKFGEDTARLCKNTHEHCSWWALVGECINNAERKCSFMCLVLVHLPAYGCLPVVFCPMVLLTL